MFATEGIILGVTALTVFVLTCAGAVLFCVVIIVIVVVFAVSGIF